MSETRTVTINPSEKQRQFLRAKRKYVAYGGARGGGKSWVLREKARMMAEHYPGIKQLIIRRTFRELTNNHINPMREMLLGEAAYNKSDKVFTFSNGSTISFGYCDCDADLGQYQGAEYDIIYIDEATNLQEEWIRKITACCRGVNGYVKRVYITCNPGGVSHAFVKRLFVDRKFQAGER